MTISFALTLWTNLSRRSRLSRRSHHALPVTSIILPYRELKNPKSINNMYLKLALSLKILLMKQICYFRFRTGSTPYMLAFHSGLIRISAHFLLSSLVTLKIWNDRYILFTYFVLSRKQAQRYYFFHLLGKSSSKLYHTASVKNIAEGNSLGTNVLNCPYIPKR